MKVVLAQAAVADLERIGDVIASDKPRRAVTFIAEIRESCRDIGRNPLAYAMAGARFGGDVRRKVHGNFLIFYRITGGAVEVLRVLHGAMNFDEALFGLGRHEADDG